MFVIWNVGCSFILEYINLAGVAKVDFISERYKPKAFLHTFTHSEMGFPSERCQLDYNDLGAP